jgi:hypothetical protein
VINWIPEKLNFGSGVALWVGSAGMVGTVDGELGRVVKVGGGDSSEIFVHPNSKPAQSSSRESVMVGNLLTLINDTLL